MTPAKVKSVVDASLVGGVTYQGTLDASAPADLSNATKGDLYIISVAGTYAGKTWAVGDHLLVNADMGGTLDSSKIDKVDNTDAVTSVAGRTGAITLSTADVSGLATVASTGAYSDLSGTPTLGTASAEDVGTGAGNVVQLDGSARLPAVDGSQLTNLPASSLALDDLTDVTITAAASGEVLRYDGTAWVDAQLAYSDLSGTPTLGTASAEDVGTGAGNVVQLDGSARLPAVDGSQLTNLPGGDAFYVSSVNSTRTAAQITDNRHQTYRISQSGITLTLQNASGTPTTSPAIGGIVTLINTSSGSVTINSPAGGLGPFYLLASGSGSVQSFTLEAGARISFVWASGNSLMELAVSTLNGLSDVVISGAASGEVLRYNGSAWVDAQLAYSDLSGAPTNVSSFTNDAGYLTDITAENLGDLSDVAYPSAPTDGQILKWVNANSRWEPAAHVPSAPSVTSGTPGSTYSITTHDGIEEIYLLTPSVDCTVSIPAAEDAGSGYKYYIKNLSANVLTINATIDGQASFDLSVQYSAIGIVSDGTNWFIF